MRSPPRADDELWQRIRYIRGGGGAVLGPFEAWLLLRGMRTLHLRVAAACANALAIAQRFQGHPQLSHVLYPGLASHPGHAVAVRQMRGGFGGMLSLRLRAGEDAAKAFTARLRVFKRATSLGSVESLAEHRASVEGPGHALPGRPGAPVDRHRARRRSRRRHRAGAGDDGIDRGRHGRGMTLIESRVVTIVAILALMAVPALQERIVREQVAAAVPLADVAKPPIAAAWAGTQTFPADNAAAGLPIPAKIVSNYVSSVVVANGAIHMTFGNSANGLLKGKIADHPSRRGRRCADRADRLGLRQCQLARPDDSQGRKQDRPFRGLAPGDLPGTLIDHAPAFFTRPGAPEARNCVIAIGPPDPEALLGQALDQDPFAESEQRARRAC